MSSYRCSKTHATTGPSATVLPNSWKDTSENGHRHDRISNRDPHLRRDLGTLRRLHGHLGASIRWRIRPREPEGFVAADSGLSSIGTAIRQVSTYSRHNQSRAKEVRCSRNARLSVTSIPVGSTQPRRMISLTEKCTARLDAAYR